MYFKAKHDKEQVLLALDQGVGELEVDLLAGELLVDAGEGLGLVLDVGLLGLVQVDLEQTRTVLADPDPLADYLSWVDEVVQDVVMHSLQGQVIDCTTTL